MKAAFNKRTNKTNLPFIINRFDSTGSSSELINILVTTFINSGKTKIGLRLFLKMPI